MTTPTIELCETFATRCMNEGLSGGLGSPQPGKMCIEALWCNVLGLPHGDDSQCVANSVRRFNIHLNDVRHESNDARAKCLVRLGIAQIGSKGVVDDRAFVKRVAEMVIRELLPPLFRRIAERIPSHANQLRAAARNCEESGTESAARDAANAANAATNAACAANDAANAAANATNAACADDAANAAANATNAACAANAAAYAAANATNAACAANAAAYAAYAAASAANAACADDDLRRNFLQHTANIGERALRELNSPGIAYLDELESRGVVPPMTVVDPK